MKYNFIETVHECHFYGFTPLLEAPESNGCLTDDYDRLKSGVITINIEAGFLLCMYI